jgi:hypothetical protein
LRQFNRLQVGRETTKGTLVAATRQLIGDHDMVEVMEFYRSNYPAGIVAPVGGAGVVVSRGTTISTESELSAEEVLWPLLTGVKGQVAPVATGSEQLWTFTPEHLTGVKTLDTATLEMVRSDGVTNHYYGEAGYGMARSFGFDWTFNEVAKMKWELFGRARQTGTPTAALTPYTSREALVSNLCAIYLDTSWATLGTTLQQCVIRSVSYEYMTGLEPDYTMDGRTDADFCDHMVKEPGSKLTLELEFDSYGSTLFGKYRANELCYIRLKNTGSTITTNPKMVQVDGAYRFDAPPSFSETDDQVLMTATLEGVYDATGLKWAEFQVRNTLAAAGL